MKDAPREQSASTHQVVSRGHFVVEIQEGKALGSSQVLVFQGPLEDCLQGLLSKLLFCALVYHMHNENENDYTWHQQNTWLSGRISVSWGGV